MLVASLISLLYVIILPIAPLREPVTTLPGIRSVFKSLPCHTLSLPPLVILITYGAPSLSAGAESIPLSIMFVTIPILALNTSIAALGASTKPTSKN